MLDYKEFKRVERLSIVINGYEIDNPLIEFLISIKNTECVKKFVDDKIYYEYDGVAMFFKTHNRNNENVVIAHNNFFETFDKYFIVTYGKIKHNLEHFGYQVNFVDKFLEDLKIE